VANNDSSFSPVTNESSILAPPHLAIKESLFTPAENYDSSFFPVAS